MKRNLSIIVLLILAGLILLYFASSEQSEMVLTETPIDSPTLAIKNTPTLSIMLTNTTLTAAMGATFAAIPSSTPPPWATIIPAPGDLGWGSIHGQIVDGITGLPIEGAIIRCEQLSDTSPYLCDGVTLTDSDGMYAFTDVFFRETDRITLFVETPGYMPLSFDVQQALIPPADFQTNLGLFPLTDGTQTPTPYLLMCTPPACSGGVLICGGTDGCPGGCGAVCLLSTPTP